LFGWNTKQRQEVQFSDGSSKLQIPVVGTGEDLQKLEAGRLTGHNVPDDHSKVRERSSSFDPTSGKT